LELRNAGILKSRKGKGGGYYLLKKPEEVNLATVIRLFDGAIGMIPCVTYVYYEKCEECQDENTCGVRAVFKEVRDVTVDLLKNLTLAGILKKEKELKKKKK
jgi:Rrf2 family protein